MTTFDLVVGDYYRAQDFSSDRFQQHEASRAIRLAARRLRIIQNIFYLIRFQVRVDRTGDRRHREARKISEYVFGRILQQQTDFVAFVDSQTFQ